MKISSKSLAMVSVLFVFSAGSCALIGYDLHDYGSAGGADAGKGGGGSAQGGGDAGLSSGSTSSDTSSSSSSGISCPECNDGNPCTKDNCMSGRCTNTPFPAKDDGNACTLDTCDEKTGTFPHPTMPGCCAHSACVAGNGPLNKAACNPMGPQPSCVEVVCSVKSKCCDMRWDQECVDQVRGLCVSVPGAPDVLFKCDCQHPYCVIGEALDPNCDPCVSEICKANKKCCLPAPDGAWDQSCIDATTKYCGIPSGAPCQ